MTDRHDPIGPTPHSEVRSSLRRVGRDRALDREAGAAIGIETIGFVDVIVMIVLFVLGYFGRGRRA